MQGRRRAQVGLQVGTNKEADWAGVGQQASHMSTPTA